MDVPKQGLEPRHTSHILLAWVGFQNVEAARSCHYIAHYDHAEIEILSKEEASRSPP